MAKTEKAEVDKTAPTRIMLFSKDEPQGRTFLTVEAAEAALKKGYQDTPLPVKE